MANYSKTAKTVSTKAPTATPQTQVIPGREANMAQNNAGGYSFVIDIWDRVDRFIILGTDSNTYYATAQKLSEENASVLIDAIKLDGVRVVNRIVEISKSGRAPKNDPALFALGLVFAYGDAAAQTAAEQAVCDVARIGTHILHLAEYVNALRGWGRRIRRAFGNWYIGQSPKGLAVNLTKYANRDGWTHRDILRLAHPKADGEYQQLLAYAAEKSYNFEGTSVASYMNAVEAVKRETNTAKIAQLISDHKLSREVLPTQALNDAQVWEALLPHMGMGVLVRNLATMTRVGVISPNGEGTKNVLSRMRDMDELKKSKLHPINVLSALMTYRRGAGIRGAHVWTPVQKIIDVLDEMFYNSFGGVVPTGKNILYAIDCSASMDAGKIAGIPGLVPRTFAACLAMVAARTETDATFTGFSTSLDYIPISSRSSLEDTIQKMERFNWGGTDCALPMLWAEKKKMRFDGFVTITDSDTWAGAVHPSQALKKYRQTMGVPAKSAVVGVTAESFSIADPNDPLSADFVGADSNTPNLISDFFRS